MYQHAARTVIRLRGSGVVLVDLNLDTALGDELGNLKVLKRLAEDGRVTLALEAIVESVKVGRRDEVLKVERLCGSDAFFLPTLTSSMLNLRASGARFGPDQKGVPFELTWSLGRL